MDNLSVRLYKNYIFKVVVQQIIDRFGSAPFPLPQIWNISNYSCHR